MPRLPHWGNGRKRGSNRCDNRIATQVRYGLLCYAIKGRPWSFQLYILLSFDSFCCSGGEHQYSFYWLVLVLERIPKSGIQESRPPCGGLISGNRAEPRDAVNSPEQYCSEQYFSCDLNIHCPMLMKLGILLTIYEPYNLTKFRPIPSTGSRANGVCDCSLVWSAHLYGQSSLDKTLTLQAGSTVSAMLSTGELLWISLTYITFQLFRAIILCLMTDSHHFWTTEGEEVALVAFSVKTSLIPLIMQRVERRFQSIRLLWASPLQ